MAVDDMLILKLEKLAKLKLTADERAEMAHDLQKMIGMVDKISEVDTAAVEPLLYMHNEKSVLRADTVGNTLDKKVALKNAPKEIDGQFAVPQIIKK